MPGTVIARHLRPFNHQNFYKVARWFLYELTSRQTRAALEPEAALRIVDVSIQKHGLVWPEETLTFRSQLSELHKASVKMVDDTRSLAQRAHKGKNLYPYNDDIWDLFFSEITVATVANTQQIRQIVEGLQVPDSIPTTQLENISAGWPELLVSLPDVVLKHVAAVEDFLDPDVVEVWMEKRHS
ncbi:MAG: hypothetical protein AAFV33_17030 [Chloroflexota bacterium]